MTPLFRVRRATAALAAAVAVAVALAAGCGDDDEPDPPRADDVTTTTSAPAAETTQGTANGNEGPSNAQPAAGDKPPRDKEQGPTESGDADPRLTGLERAAMRTVEDFVAALDARDGALACSLLAPGALSELRLPHPKGGCAVSLEASIGYRDPRGLPVWKHAEVTQVGLPELEGETAKVVGTVITRFADREEVSVEDDVFYLQRAANGWALAKPSSTLYRAVGIADVPPTVLSPP
jgi:hypothetical protein